MEHSRSLEAFGVATLAALAWVGVAYAQTVPVNPCAGAKARCVSKHVKSLLQCHQRAETKGSTVDALCVQKAGDKLQQCVTKAEVKLPCLTLGDGAALANTTDAFVQYMVLQLDPSYPAPIANKCSAAKKKAVGDTTARRLDCLATAFKRTPGTVDPACLAKAEAKLADGITRADAKPPCLTSGDGGTLEASVDAFFADRVTALSGTGGACGNGQNDVGEACDASAPSAGWTDCGPGHFCSGCGCSCPTRFEITLDATDPASVLDLGWTGLGHRQELSTDNTITLRVTACSGTAEPCGTCTLTGPVANRAGKIANRRCSNDTAIRCANDTPCAAEGGTCEYFFGSWHPRAGFGLSACIAHRLEGPVGGTVGIETGEISLTSSVKRESYAGLSIDAPCARCLGDGSPNDGIADGSCSGGTRNGQACDGNATAPSYPDFGVTSLDCPPGTPETLVAALTLPLESATQQVVRTVTAASPNRIGAPGEKCLCSTCNNANAEPCSANADCPTPPGPIGPICGGLRCLGGTNAGTPCTTASECPSGFCSRPGEPTETSACLDDPGTPGVFDCTDTAPFDGEGECLEGPVESTCTIASGHPQRGCLNDAHCGGGVGTCESRNRRCFLTGSIPGFGAAGTGTLVADGAADAPIDDVAHPTLAAVGCVGPTGSSQLNNISGFPGPMRFTQKVTATALP